MTFFKNSDFNQNNLMFGLFTTDECECANVRVQTSNGGALSACKDAQIESSSLPCVTSA